MNRPTLQQLAQRRFDLVVIGGGVTGAATARDAALRGLTVLLVEADDFAAGTSSRSSKLIHGGLRYLQTYQFKLVAESVREREKSLRLAPHLTEVRPFIYLLYAGYPESKRLLNLGLTFYDFASGAPIRRHHKMLSAAKVLEREPALNPSGLLGGGLYYDVLTDDARLTLDLAKGAAAAGATLINHAAAAGLLLEDGRARGVRIEDRITGESCEVRARQVVNCTGPWTDYTRALERTESTHHLRPTKGVHITLRKRDFPLNTAVFLRSPDDNRVVWPTPSLEDDVVYIGTTDTDYTGSVDDVHPEPEDIRYLLNVANHTIPDAHVSEEHVVGSWAGLRPLVAPPPGVSESNTSREHEITEGPTGMLTISGGKLTTSRVMAKQLVDRVEKALDHRSRYRAGEVVLPGADPARVRELRQRAAAGGVPSELVDTWVRRYGANADAILDRYLDDPASREELGVRRLTRAEIGYCVAEEMVQTLADLLVRRTSAFFWDATGGLSQVQAVADELERLVPWEPGRKEREITEYRQLVEQHRPVVPQT